MLGPPWADTQIMLKGLGGEGLGPAGLTESTEGARRGGRGP